MRDVNDLEELQLDALREVANIGAGHAATALSQLTHRRIMISVPEISVVPLEQAAELVGDPQDIVAGVLMHMLGDLTGRILFMVPDHSARLMCDMLLKRDAGATREFGALEESGLKEAGNILGGAYMNALSDFMGMMLLPSVPSLVIDHASAVLTAAYLNFSSDRDYVFCVETDFSFEDNGEQLAGYFLLLPDVASLRSIFDAIRIV